MRDSSPSEPHLVTMTSLKGVVLPGQSMRFSLSLSPDRLTRPSRVTIEDEIAQNFLVTDLLVGRNSQLISRSSVPAGLFNPSLPDCYFDVLHPGLFLSLWVFNTSPAEQPFRFTASGEVLPRERPNLSPPSGRCVFLGFGNTTMPPGMPTEISEMTQVAFSPSRLYVPPGVLEQVTIASLANRPFKSILTNTVPERQLAREHLREGRLLRLLPDPVARVADVLTICATHEAEKNLAFSAALVGEIQP
jgi:hypothetical protein